MRLSIFFTYLNHFHFLDNFLFDLIFLLDWLFKNNCSSLYLLYSNYWIIPLINVDLKKSVLNIHSKDWCWSWKSNTLVTWCEDLTHLKRPWCWQRLKAGGEGDNREWDGWMASLTQWTWVWVNSGSWWWTGRPGLLQALGSQRVRHDWVTELNCTESYLLEWVICLSTLNMKVLLWGF